MPERFIATYVVQFPGKKDAKLEIAEESTEEKAWLRGLEALIHLRIDGSVGGGGRLEVEPKTAQKAKKQA